MQTCETCRFLEPDNRPDYTGCGTCRRFPPIVVETVAFDGSGGNHFSQHRPWMNKGEWCGEHQEPTQVSNYTSTTFFSRIPGSGGEKHGRMAGFSSGGGETR